MPELLLTSHTAFPLCCTRPPTCSLRAHPTCAQSSSGTKLLVISWFCSIVLPQDFGLCICFCMSRTLPPSAKSYLFFRLLLGDYFLHWAFPAPSLPDLVVFWVPLWPQHAPKIPGLSLLLNWKLLKIQPVSVLFTVVSPTPSTGLPRSTYLKVLAEWMTSRCSLSSYYTEANLQVGTPYGLYVPLQPLAYIRSPVTNHEFSPFPF